MVMPRPPDLPSCVTITAWPPLLCQLGSFALQPSLVGPPRALNSVPLLFAEPPLPSDLCLFLVLVQTDLLSKCLQFFPKGRTERPLSVLFLSLRGEGDFSLSRSCIFCV